MSEHLEAELYACLANPGWVRAVASGMLDAGEKAMDRLTDEEWLDAMKAHPRIGEQGGDARTSSEREQAVAMRSSDETLHALAADNRRYEEKFGHVFLIFASGRSGDEILSELRRRMNNDPKAELEEAKRELRKIALLRLRRVVSA